MFCVGEVMENGCKKALHNGIQKQTICQEQTICQVDLDREFPSTSDIASKQSRSTGGKSGVAVSAYNGDVSASLVNRNGCSDKPDVIPFQVSTESCESDDTGSTSKLRQILPASNGGDLSSHRRRKLVLHFDIRNTILLADSLTEDGVEQALNTFLTGVTWGCVDPETDRWMWCSDRPTLTAPCPGAITYYKNLEPKLVRVPSDRAVLRQATGDFTSEPIGQRFRPYFDSHLELLRWNYRSVDEDLSEPERKLTMFGKDKQTAYHYLLPSFIKLLHDLSREEREFSIVLRTYGRDAPNVLSCIAHILRGRTHPEFKTPLPITVNTLPGQIHRKSDGMIRCEVDSDGNISTYENETDIYGMLNDWTGVYGFVDDFNHWQQNGYNHLAGKPLWIDPDDVGVQHILFDDNIRVTDVDSIVDVRMRSGDSGAAWRSLERDEISQLENVCLVQADLLESTSNVDYFADRVKICVENYSRWLETRVKQE